MRRSPRVRRLDRRVRPAVRFGLRPGSCAL